MGQAESTAKPGEQSEQSVVEDDLYNKDHFEFVRQVSDPRLGDVNIVKHKINERLLAVQSKYCTSKEDFETSLGSLEQIKFFNHPNILKCVDIRSEEDQGFCSQVFVIRAVHEYLELSLQEEINSRVQEVDEDQQNNEEEEEGQEYQQNSEQKRIKNKFTEREIVHMLQDMVAGLQYLKEQNVEHGEITPSNIMIGHDYDGNTQYKLHIPLMARQNNQYQKVLINGQEEDLYLSPELFAAYGNQITNPREQINEDLDGNEIEDGYCYKFDIQQDDSQTITNRWNQESADIFAVGIIALQVALLEEVDSCYNFNNFEIDHEVVQSKLQQVADEYSEELAETLISFLETHVSSRYTFLQALEELGQHQEAKNIEEEINVDFQHQSPETQKLIQSQHQPEVAQDDQEEEEQPQEGFDQEQEQIQEQDYGNYQDDFQQEEEQVKHAKRPQQQELQANPYQDTLGVPQQNTQGYSQQSLKKSRNFQNSNKKQEQSQQQQVVNEQLNSSLKNIDQLVKEALNRSEETKQRYEQNIQLRQFMQDLLDDEIFVPIQSSPTKKSQSIQKSTTAKNFKAKPFKPEQWKI